MLQMSKRGRDKTDQDATIVETVPELKGTKLSTNHTKVKFIQP
jgi:hypothetical protein